ncbi:peptidylprolyl isomerase [Paraburkholderia kururiensis]|uniref:peptidylprolyl isomerase n=1 Tax=Paraburkholderia kururiensis TaxID=984307 RepID=UPI001F0C16C0|nr:peptidyl-prolyl cis-trans isomerase [Paraburkholderia kururiensis]
MTLTTTIRTGRPLLIALALAAPATLTTIPAQAAGIQGEAGAATAVATVNGVPVSLAQVQATIAAAAQPDTPGARQLATDGLIARELIRQAAEADRLGTASAVREAEHRAHVDTENRLYIARHAQPQPVTEAQVRARYDATVAELGPIEYRATVMTLADEPAARAAAMRLAHDEPFTAAASEQAQTVALPWISFRTPPQPGHTQGLPPALAQTLTTLEPGALSAPFAVDGRWMIVRLVERRATVIPAYDAVRPRLRAMLEAQARDDAFMRMVDALAAKATIVPPQARPRAAR